MRSLTLAAAIGLPALSRGAVQFTEAALPLSLADKAERSVQQLWNFGEEGYGAVGLHGAGSVESCEAWAFKAQLVRLRYSGLDSRASRRNNVAIGSSQFWQPGAAFVARLPGSTGPSVSWMQKALKNPVSRVQFGAAGSPMSDLGQCGSQCFRLRRNLQQMQSHHHEPSRPKKIFMQDSGNSGGCFRNLGSEDRKLGCH